MDSGLTNQTGQVYHGSTPPDLQSILLINAFMS
jgi:hypothetical protein